MQRTRELMVVEGMAQVATNGIRVGLEELSLAKSGAAAGISADDAVAAWADGPDDAASHFREAVAVRILREQPGIGDYEISGGGLTETLVAVSAVIEAMPEIATIAPEERGEWLRRACRAGSDTNHAMADRSRLWQSYVAISAGLLSLPSIPPALEAAWRHGEEHAAARYLNLYTVMAQMFGFRLRYCYTWQQFTTAVSALSEGLMIRSNVSPHVREVVRFTGPDGGEESWTLFGVCLEGLIQQFFEPDESEIETLLQHENPPPADDQ